MKTDLAQGLIDDPEGQGGLGGVPAADADKKLGPSGLDSTLHHGGFSQSGLANDEYRLALTPTRVGEETTHHLQRSLALPDLRHPCALFLANGSRYRSRVPSVVGPRSSFGDRTTAQQRGRRSMPLHRSTPAY